MATLTTQPINPNFLSQINMRFTLKRAPNLSFFAVGAELPSLTMDVIEQPTSFITLPLHGSKIKYDDFTLTFKVQEDFSNYLEIYEWMNGIGFPDDFTGFPKIQSGDGVYSDGTLTVHTSAKNPNMEFTFINMFPYHLGGLTFDVQSENVEEMNCSVTFKYQRFYMKKVD
jgi:T4-like virus tail tube protein gp19.